MRSFRYALVLALAGSAVALGSSALAADPAGTVTFAGAGGGHRVREISLSPGRVTFAQRGGTPQGTPLIKRSVSVTGSTLTLGTAATIGLIETKSGGNFAVGPDYFDGLVPGSTSGSRTLWGTEVYADTYEGGYSTYADYGARLSQGTTKLRAFASPSGPLRLSGNRALYSSASGYKVYDLKTGTAKTVKDLAGKTLWSAPGAPAYQAADLFGDYLAFVAADGSLWRKNITGSNSAVQLAAAPDADSGYVGGARVYAFGDWVGWERDFVKFGAPAGVDCGLRNAATMAPAVTLSVCPEQLTTGGVVGQDADTSVWSLRHYDGSSVDLPVPNDAKQVALDGKVLAWISGNMGRIAPYDAPVAAPRSLGNPIVGTAYKRGGPSWSLDLVTTAALKTCTVTIKKQFSKTVRVLPCTAGLLKAGEIAARWDGKNGSGVRVPAGTYLWTVTAADSDFNDLVPGDGAPGQESGKIKVS